MCGSFFLPFYKITQKKLTVLLKPKLHINKNKGKKMKKKEKEEEEKGVKQHAKM